MVIGSYTLVTKGYSVTLMIDYFYWFLGCLIIMIQINRMLLKRNNENDGFC